MPDKPKPTADQPTFVPQPADKNAAAAAEDLNPDTLPDKINPLDVQAKMAAGLTKDQATEVCLAQLEHDKAQKKSTKK